MRIGWLKRWQRQVEREWHAPLGLCFLACRSFTCWPSMLHFAVTPTRRCDGELVVWVTLTGLSRNGVRIDSFAAWLGYGRDAQL